MKTNYLLLFLLLFSFQTVFSQDFSKMSIDEKTNVLMYGDLYPYSLLLESGTDTLRMYHLGKDLTLYFEEGKLIKTERYGDTTIFHYEGNKIVKRYHGYRNISQTRAMAYFPRYRNDTLIGIADLFVEYDDRNYSSGQYYYNEDMCLSNDGSSLLCFYYRGDSIFAIDDIWIFQKDKITKKKRILDESTEIENLVKTYYIKDDYLHILIENYHTQGKRDGFALYYDFIMEEKHEIKFKIRKVPKDKTKEFGENNDY